ncbi:hypothetical protein PAXINDRAFT_14177 [Paxillus involutus ATCC 200175]|uniref:Zn(2)-C6 fungal-type domain-containing protein n=1 Tax=Paxillus involutus ATCC 200175 TaxID=664439 RepID=A0A0C9TR73_PAXIN|nr:hypothetical protein PAXINDRAFT_14177 [Paxillus involutus ATCC 200175]
MRSHSQGFTAILIRNETHPSSFLAASFLSFLNWLVILSAVNDITGALEEVSEDAGIGAMFLTSPEGVFTGLPSSLNHYGHVVIGQKRKACVGCAARKIRCEFTPGATVCRRCQNVEAKCIPKESRARPAHSKSAPQAPSDSDVSIQQHSQPTTGKQRGLPKSDYRPMDLEAVIEDELSDSASINVTLVQHNLMIAKHAEDLASALYVADNSDVDAQPVDGMDSQGEEIFDIGDVSSGDSDHSEDEDNVTPLAGHWQNPRSGSQSIKPNTQPTKSLKRKSVPQPPTVTICRLPPIFFFLSVSFRSIPYLSEL